MNKKSFVLDVGSGTGHHVRNVKVGYITKLEQLLENVLLNITETMKETYHDGRERDIRKAEDILYKSYKLSFDDDSDVRYKKVISPIGYIFNFMSLGSLLSIAMIIFAFIFVSKINPNEKNK